MHISKVNEEELAKLPVVRGMCIYADDIPYLVIRTDEEETDPTLFLLNTVSCYVQYMSSSNDSLLDIYKQFLKRDRIIYFEFTYKPEVVILGL